MDDFGRTIAVRHAIETEYNAEMVLKGLAWAFGKYTLDYADLEDAINKPGVGVWQAETQAPWGYRAAKWEGATQIAPGLSNQG